MGTAIYYVIPCVLAMLGALQYDFSNHLKGKKLLWGIIYIYLVLLMGLRFEVGGDTLTYMSWFEWAKDISRWRPFDPINIYEPGFTFIAAVVKYYGGDFYHLQIIHALILNTCIFVFITQNTRYWFMSLLMAFVTYYLYFSTEILRESIAIFIFILNYRAFQEKNWKKYYIGVVCCLIFHYSSSFLLLLPLIRSIRFNQKYLLIVLCFTAMCVVLKPIFSLVETVAPAIGAKAVSYGKHTYVGYLWAGLRIFQFSIIPLITLYVCHAQFHYHPKFEFSYLMLILLGIGIVFSPIIFQRFTNYFYPLLSLSLADVVCRGIRSININKRILSTVMALVIVFGYGSYFVYLNFYQMWIPYYSILNPVHYSPRERFANGGGG